MGFLVDEETRGGLLGTVECKPMPLTGQAPLPMLLDAVSHHHIQTRTRVASPDPATGFWAVLALSTNDPDLDAYGGRQITLPGQAPVLVEVPYNAPLTTVTSAMAAQVNPGGDVDLPRVGDQVRARWFHQLAGYTAPTPTNAYLTASQTTELIASAVAAGGGGGSGGGDLPEYSPAAQTAAVTASGLVGKTTRFNTTTAAISQPLPAATPGAVVAIGWDAGPTANPLTLTAASGDVIGSGSATSVPVPVVNAVVQLHCTTAGRWRVVGGHLPSSYVVFNSANTDVSGASVGKVVAVGAVDGQGKVTSWNLVTPSGGSGSASTEDVQDIVGAMVIQGVRITATYNDAAGTLTIATTATQVSVGGSPVGTLAIDDTPVSAAEVGALALANNLSDIPDKAAARTNLGVTSGGGGSSGGDPQSLWQAGHAEATTRYNNYGDTALVAGELEVVYFTALKAVTLARLGFQSGNTAAAGITLGRLALFTVAADDSLTLVARTANDTTLGNATYAQHDRALSTAGGYPASYSLVAGTRYAFGLLFAGGTPASIRSIDASVGATLAPSIARQATGQSDINASYSGSALGRLYRASYMYGLAAA